MKACGTAIRLLSERLRDVAATNKNGKIKIAKRSAGPDKCVLHEMSAGVFIYLLIRRYALPHRPAAWRELREAGRADSAQALYPSRSAASKSSVNFVSVKVS